MVFAVVACFFAIFPAFIFGGFFLSEHGVDGIDEGFAKGYAILCSIIGVVALVFITIASLNYSKNKKT